MSARVLKWDVPVDDQPHRIGGGDVIHVDSQRGRSDEIQVWTFENDQPVRARVVRVFGTGHTVPLDAKPLGSVVVGGGHLVWHVFEVF